MNWSGIFRLALATPTSLRCLMKALSGRVWGKWRHHRSRLPLESESRRCQELITLIVCWRLKTLSLSLVQKRLDEKVCIAVLFDSCCVIFGSFTSDTVSSVVLDGCKWSLAWVRTVLWWSPMSLLWSLNLALLELLKVSVWVCHLTCEIRGR